MTGVFYAKNKWKLNKRELKGFKNIHAITPQCHEFGCVIHHWSKHHMRRWPLVWRNDKGLFERTCPHGQGHPDPDSASHNDRIGNGSFNNHACDLCCNLPARKFAESLEAFGFTKTKED